MSILYYTNVATGNNRIEIFSSYTRTVDERVTKCCKATEKTEKMTKPLYQKTIPKRKSDNTKRHQNCGPT